MSESNTLERISDYIVKNKLKAALEVEVKYMVVKAKEAEVHLECPGMDFEPEPPDKQHIEVTSQRLDAIYDDEPLGFEKDLVEPNIKMLAHDPLEEIYLGNGISKRPTYISANLSPELKVEVIQLFK